MIRYRRIGNRRDFAFSEPRDSDKLLTPSLPLTADLQGMVACHQAMISKYAVNIAFFYKAQPVQHHLFIGCLWFKIPGALWYRLVAQVLCLVVRQWVTGHEFVGVDPPGKLFDSRQPCIDVRVICPAKAYFFRPE